jgi:hypothetical protein
MRFPKEEEIIAVRDFGGGVCEVETGELFFNVWMKDLTEEQKKAVRRRMK